MGFWSDLNRDMSNDARIAGAIIMHGMDRRAAERMQREQARRAKNDSFLRYATEWGIAQEKLKFSREELAETARLNAAQRETFLGQAAEAYAKARGYRSDARVLEDTEDLRRRDAQAATLTNEAAARQAQFDAREENMQRKFNAAMAQLTALVTKTRAEAAELNAKAAETNAVAAHQQLNTQILRETYQAVHDADMAKKRADTAFRNSEAWINREKARDLQAAREFKNTPGVREAEWSAKMARDAAEIRGLNATAAEQERTTAFAQANAQTEFDVDMDRKRADTAYRDEETRNLAVDTDTNRFTLDETIKRAATQQAASEIFSGPLAVLYATLGELKREHAIEPGEATVVEKALSSPTARDAMAGAVGPTMADKVADAVAVAGVASSTTVAREVGTTVAARRGRRGAPPPPFSLPPPGPQTGQMGRPRPAPAPSTPPAVLGGRNPAQGGAQIIPAAGVLPPPTPTTAPFPAITRGGPPPGPRPAVAAPSAGDRDKNAQSIDRATLYAQEAGLAIEQYYNTVLFSILSLASQPDSRISPEEYRGMLQLTSANLLHVLNGVVDPVFLDLFTANVQGFAGTAPPPAHEPKWVPHLDHTDERTHVFDEKSPTVPNFYAITPRSEPIPGPKIVE